MPISEVSLTGIKGIRHTVNLKLDGESIILLGDNGTGKSSIERGLRWALTGHPAPSPEPNLTTEEGALNNILADGQPPSVSVKLSDGSVITSTPSGTHCDGSGARYRDACTLSNPFLRRAELQVLITTRPVDRFKFLEMFLDIEDADGACDALSTAAIQHGKIADRATERVSDLFRKVLGGIPFRNGSDCPSWATMVDSIYQFADQLGQGTSTLDKWEHLITILPRIRELTKGDALATKRVLLRNAFSAAKKIEQAISSSYPATLEHVVDSRRKLAEKTDENSLTELLHHAKEHILRSDDSVCPVCGQPFDRAATLEQLEKRLNALLLYTDALALEKKTTGQWQNWLSSIRVEYQVLADALSPDCANDQQEHPSTPASIVDLMKVPVDDKELLEATILRYGSVEIREALISAIDATSHLLKERLETLPAEGSESELRQLIQLVERAETNHSSIERYYQEYASASRRREILNTIADAIRKARQDIASTLLSDISTLVTEYYNEIHQKTEDTDETKAPRIVVQRRGRGQAFVHASFAGKEIKSPEWIYSDGHLDTVAICIFLALRRFRANMSGDPKLMVLDDVVLSIDLTHGRQLIRLLSHRFADHQIVLLTHNGLFANWCYCLMPQLRKMHISGWTLEGGPRIGNYVSAIERIEKTLVDGAPKEVAVEMMQLMDEFLLEARFVYGLSVPAKYGEQYTLSDIWAPFVKAVKNMSREIGKPLDPVLQLLELTKEMPIMRNQLAAHENQFAHEYPTSTAKDIAGKALEIVRALYCTKCCRFAIPIPNREKPSLLHCRCKKLVYMAESLSPAKQ